jgi:integrase
MAHIRSYDTQRKRKGKTVRVHRVIWREQATDANGLPIPGKLIARQETYPTREAAEARRDELNAARHTTGTTALADQRKAGMLTFGHYAQAWLDQQAVKVSQGKLKSRTVSDYDRLLRCYVLLALGPMAVAAVTSTHTEQLLATLVRQPSRQGDREPLTPGTVKHVWDVTRRVLRYAVQHKAIAANPCDAVDFSASRGMGDHADFTHNPLTAEQIGRLSTALAGNTPAQPLPAYPVYALLVEFMAYSGLRASEVTGLEVGDLMFAPGPRCSVKVQRTKARKNGQWVMGTLKSAKSARTVPLPPWLATRLADYLANTHPHGDIASADYCPQAPLWPSRKNGGGYRAAGQRYAVPFDWSQPLAMGTFYDTIFKPALEAVGLPASWPATATEPAVRGIRLHDLRHTFAVMQLSAGVHFMQVSKWLGHSTYTLTLDTYGDYIPEEDGGVANNLPEPPAPANTHADVSQAELPSNVVSLFSRQAN